MDFVKISTVLLVGFLVTGCGPATIDGSSEIAFKDSIKAVAQQLPETEREQFGNQVIGVYLNIRTDMTGTIDAIGDVGSSARHAMDGMSKDDVVARFRHFEMRSEIREQVVSGVNLAAGARAAVGEYYWDLGKFPENNSQAGVTEADAINVEGVLSVTVLPDGRIEVLYGNGTHDELDGKTIFWIASATSSSEPNWSCSSEDISDNLLPDYCKSYQ